MKLNKRIISTLLCILLFVASANLNANGASENIAKAPGAETTDMAENTSSNIINTSDEVVQKANNRGSNKVYDNFSSGSYAYRDIVLPYREAFVHQEIEGPYALVVYLHGHSANGTDNVSQLSKHGVTNSVQYFETIKSKAIILAPQCASDRQWNEDASQVAGGVTMTEALKDWLDNYISTHDIDRSRIYILGDSAGGAGVWRMVSDYPDMFAAAMPAVSIPRATLQVAKKTPICCVIGGADDVVSVDKVQPFITALQSLGGDVFFKVLDGSTHQDACRDAFTEDCLAWVFGHVHQAGYSFN